MSMIRKITMAFLFIASSCGGAYTVTVPPVTINVVHSLDLTSLIAPFTAYCRQLLGPTATDAQVYSCMETQLANFTQSIEAALNSATK